MTNIGFLDGILLNIAPEFAAKRIAWKNYVKGFYDSGSSSRVNAGWNVINSTAERTNQGERDRIRGRARDLERNADLCESIISALIRNVVSSGFKLQAKVENPDGTENDALNNEIEEYVLDWMKAENCDISGRLSFREILEMIVRRTEIDGGLLIIKCYEESNKYPFCLQIREVDDIASNMFEHKNPKDGSRIVNGIEINKYNKHIAYYIQQNDIDGFYGNVEKVDAKNVIYLNRIKRPSQIREISGFSTTANRVRDINEFVSAISMKERILACLSVFIKKNNPTISSGMNNIGRNGVVQNIAEETSTPARKIGPGYVQELGVNEDVTVVNPSGQSTDAKEFFNFQTRLAASGRGLSFETVSRDMSQTNYSSARQGQLEDRGTYQSWQLYLIEHFLSVIYPDIIECGVLTGKLKIKDFFQNKDMYCRHKWIPSGWSWIDPLKEVNANTVALNSGQTTLAEICAQQGRDWKDVLKQRKKEDEVLKKLNLKDTGGKTDETK